MNRTARVAIAAVATLLLLAPVVLAQGGRDRERARPRDASAGQAQGELFTAEEKRLIRDWYGQAKIAAEPLPPGIAKNLARGKPLPPGIAKKTIPSELLTRLPSRPDYERLVVGTDIVLVRSGIVVDILVGVLF